MLIKVPIQGMGLWQGWNVFLNGGGGPKSRPLGGHHGGPVGPLNGPPSGPPKGSLSEHSKKPSVNLVGGPFGRIPSGLPSKPPSRPLGGPPMGPYLGGGYLMVVPLQWAHGQDILGDHGYQLSIQHQLVQPLMPTSQGNLYHIQFISLELIVTHMYTSFKRLFRRMEKKMMLTLSIYFTSR